MNLSRIRGLATAGMLCAALAGCGTAAAATAAGAGAPEVGCASVSQATSATVTRHRLVPESPNGGTRTYRQHNATKVRALFGDFCSALAHATIPRPPIFCPADFGSSYTGTFYDGRRVLATFDYTPTGCQRVSLTASGKSRSTFLIGKAAAAAPHLKADMAAVLGLSESNV